MTWSRRALLRCGAAVVPVVFLPSHGRAEEFLSSVLTLVLEFPIQLAKSALGARVLEAFASRGLPVAAMLDEAKASDEPLVSSNSEQEAVWRSGLLELVAPLPDVLGQHRYMQMRAAADHRATLSRDLATIGPVVTLVARSGDEGLDWSAFRSSGFRVVLAPDGTALARPQPVGRGQLRLVGGAYLSTAAGSPTLVQQVEAAVTGAPSVLLLSLADLQGPRAEDIAARIEDLASWLGERVAFGELVMLRPMDHLLQSGQLLQQEVALLIGVDEASEDAAAALLALLDDAGLPYTLVASEPILQRSGRPGDCHLWSDDPSASSSSGAEAGRHAPQERALCVLASGPEDLTTSAAARTVLLPTTDAPAWTGLRSDGRLWATVESWSSTGLGSTSWPLADRVLRIEASSVALPHRRSGLVRTLAEEAASGRVRFWSLGDWSEHLLAPEPLLMRFWDARRRLVTDPPRSLRILADDERNELLRDARAAWRYIERHTYERTGLCATTVQGRGADQVNAEATLWDIGSQVQGILAAARLGFIPWEECSARIRLIASSIPAVEIEGLRLPPAIFRADDLEPVRPRDFDLCDLGRFLIALDSAVDHGALSQEEADQIWAPWDIDAALRDGRIHTYSNGRWRDITWSHCTDYIAPAFRRRGWAIQGIFPETSGPATADQSMQILYAAAVAGSIGTEPGLLAKIETGPSEAERLLALVLFDAQLSWYEAHGEMKSVSETPLSFPPWFSYQGLVLEREGPEAWVVNTLSSAPEFQTEEFRRQALLIGSKSAYLWRANYPHAYSDRLVDVIRDRCRDEENGFAVGVFVSNLESMGDYYDINTNGIILSAIAHLVESSDPNR